MLQQVIQLTCTYLCKVQLLSTIDLRVDQKPGRQHPQSEIDPVQCSLQLLSGLLV